MRIATIVQILEHDNWSRVGRAFSHELVFNHPLFCGMVWLWLAICATQDWRYREVSNWLTIPALVIGLGIAVLAGGERLLYFVIVVLVYGIGAARNQLGGADFKIAAALGALWPQALVFGHLAVFIWGIIAKIKDKKVPFVVPLALGAVVPFLTVVVLPSIITLKDVITPAALQLGFCHVVCFLTTW